MGVEMTKLLARILYGQVSTVQDENFCISLKVNSSL